MVWIYITALLQKLEIGTVKRHGALLLRAAVKLDLLCLHEVLIYFAIDEVRTCGVFLVLSEKPELILFHLLAKAAL